MQDQLLEHLRLIRRVRARHLKELKQDFKRAVAESNERLLKVCDVVISPTGERQFVPSKQKLYDVYIAPRLRRKNARSQLRTGEQPMSPHE